MILFRTIFLIISTSTLLFAGEQKAVPKLEVKGKQTSTKSDLPEIGVTYSALKGLKRDPDDFNRRDNSDIIKVGDLYYVWYSKMNQQLDPSVSNIWYATSPDGKVWTEKGQSLTTGKESSWDDRVVYTPGILVANEKYYLFYTGQTKTPAENGLQHCNTEIGIAVSDSPDGPWKKLPNNPVLKPSEDREKFDSHRVDDSCLIVKDGKYWLYYKGRQWGKKPTETAMGVAIADKPEGPYVKSPNSPLALGGHEVLVWRKGEGVAAMVGMKLKKKELSPFYIMYAKDGIHFEKTAEIPNELSPWAPGAYRPGAFTDDNQGQRIQWGLHIRGIRPKLFLERFDLEYLKE